jgi:hypothetical protein
LPYTFDYEAGTDSIIIIEGRRTNWHPQPVQVVVRRNTFVERLAGGGAEPILANAFHVGGVDYCWLRGRREALGGCADERLLVHAE